MIRERPGFVPPPDPVESAFTGFRLNPGSAVSNGPPSQIPAKRVYVRGMRSVDWAAKDLNGDVLSYDLLFRGEDETAWKPLARGLRETYFAFDSMQLPDGLYRIRLEASDGPSNPGDTARSAYLVSDTIRIDNAPPAVRVTAGKGSGTLRVTIDVSATDAVGPIARAAYSLDAQGWVPVQPVDGVSDSRAESYRLTLEALRPGEHTVIVKVIDLLGNVGAGKATFTSP